VTLFREKMQEVGMSMLPIILIVVVLNWTLVPLEPQVFTAFLLGAVLVFMGLTVFLFGADLGIGEMGNHMGSSLAKTNNFRLVVIVGALLGFLITVAEPDLHILGNQIQTATQNALSSYSIVGVVSVGVGFMLAIGLTRTIRRWPLYRVFIGFYGLIFLISLFVPPAFLAMAFDASGATTGAMTVPFVLALGQGLSTTLMDKSSDDDVFGYVVICSIGPILAVAIMSILTGNQELRAQTVEAAQYASFWGHVLGEFLQVVIEVLVAVIPLIITFALFQAFIQKAPRRQNRRIFIGFVYTFIGLVLFLTGVNIGFMDVGIYIGSGLAGYGSGILFVGISFLMGLVVILAEPAVHVLSDQVEDVTAGAIRRSYILLSLSLGVGVAVALSALRIWLPGLQLWHILLPGFGLACAMSFFSKPLFTGLAFDSGGVASGPMAATFILAYAQGAASIVPTADVLADGFGVIALIAMTPTVAIQVLGLIYARQSRKEMKANADK
jgi:hypothetical protein